MHAYGDSAIINAGYPMSHVTQKSLCLMFAQKLPCT